MTRPRIPTPDEIRRLRQELGLTQRELADALGVLRQGTISDWECGRKRPSPISAKLLWSLKTAYRLSR